MEENIHHEVPNAAQPQFGISRAKHAKGAKEERCHFDRREKSFLDPSYPLGMTGLGPSLCDLGVLGARNFRIRMINTPNFVPFVSFVVSNPLRF
jgi:hypothetical protein